MQPALKTQSRRIISIQVCRGLAALLVVFAHLHGIETKYSATDHLSTSSNTAPSASISSSSSAASSSPPSPRENLASPRQRRYLPLPSASPASSPSSGSTPPSPSIRRHPLRTTTHSGVQRPRLLSPRPKTTSPWLPPARLEPLSYELYFYLIFFLLLLSRSPRTHRSLAPSSLGHRRSGSEASHRPLAYSPWSNSSSTRPSSNSSPAASSSTSIVAAASHPSIGIALLITSLLGLAAIIVYTDPNLNHRSPIGNVPSIYGTFWPRSSSFGAMELERTTLIRYLTILSSKHRRSWSSISIYSSNPTALVLLHRTLISRTRINTSRSPCPHSGDSILLIALIGLPAAS